MCIRDRSIGVLVSNFLEDLKIGFLELQALLPAITVNCAQLCSNHFQSFSFPFWDLSIFFQCLYMRSMTQVCLSASYHYEFWSLNCLNQFGFNPFYLCNYHFWSNFPRSRDLDTFVLDQSLSCQFSSCWEFQSCNGLNQLDFNCVQLFCNYLKPALLCAHAMSKHIF